MKFKIFIEQDEDGYFVAECPNLPGCISQGKTLKEAKENIKEASVKKFPPLSGREVIKALSRIGYVLDFPWMSS